MKIFGFSFLATLSFVAILTVTDFGPSFEIFSGNSETEVAQAPPVERRRERRRVRRRTRRRVERRMEKQSFYFVDPVRHQNWYWMA